jgi:outer membrane lipoprotein-sorting protein
MIRLIAMFPDANTKQMNWDSFGGRKGKSPLDRVRRGRLTRLVSLLLGSGLLAYSGGTGAQESVGLEKHLQETEQALAEVDNYTALFRRVEFVDGKLLPEEVTVLKFKRPFKIYMRWISPSKGQESLYVQGANNNKVRAHAGGLEGLLTVNLDPNGYLAMENSRHPITEAGLHKLVDRIASNIRRALRSGELTSNDHGEQTVYGRKTRELEGILPKDASKGYYCYRCIVNLDIETKMPIRVQIFDWENRLVECYGYERLKVNPGLSDKDFDPKNSDYHF